MGQITREFEKRAVSEFLEKNKQIYFEIDDKKEWILFNGYNLSQFGLPSKMPLNEYIEKIEPADRQRFLDVLDTVSTSKDEELPLTSHYLCFPLQIHGNELFVMQEFWHKDKRKGEIVQGGLKEISEFYEKSLKDVFVNDLRIAISKKQVINEKLREALKYVSEFFGAKASDLWVCDELKGVVSTFASYTSNPLYEELVYSGKYSSAHENEGLVGKVLSTKKLEVWNKLHENPGFVRSDEAARSGIRSAIAIPLLTQTKSLTGIIGLYFEEENIDLPRSKQILMNATSARISSQFQELILREATRRMTNFGESVIIICDQDSNVTYANRLAKDLFDGLKLDSNEAFIDYVIDEDRDLFLGLLTSLYPSKSRSQIFRLRIKNLVRWFNFTVQKKDDSYIYLHAHDVTDQINLRQNFNESSILANIGIWEMSDKEEVVECSPIVYQILDYEEAEPLTKGQIIGLFSDKGREQFEAVEESLINRTLNETEFNAKIKTFKGNSKWIKVVARMVDSDQSKKVVGTFQDITAIEKDKQRVKRLNHEKNLALEIARMGIWKIDPEKDEVYLEDSILKNFNFPIASKIISSLDWLKAINQLNNFDILDDLIDRVEKRKPIAVLCISESNGIKQYCQLIGRFIAGLGENGMYVGVCQDVSEGYVSKMALLEEGELRASILSSITEGLIMLNSEGIVVDVNHSSKEILQLSNTDYEQLEIVNLLTDVGLKRTLRQLIRLKKHNQNHNFEDYAIKLKKWFFMSLHAIPDGYIILFYDITATKSLQRENEEIRLRAIEEERNRFAMELHDGIASEIAGATMLAQIVQRLMFSDVKKAESKTTQLIGVLNNAATNTRGLSHNLRTSAVEDSGIVELINSLIFQLESFKKVNFSFEYHPWYAEEVLEEDVKVNLYRIIQELTNNIVKHSEASLAKITLNKKENRFILRIVDNGTGMDLQTTRTGIGMKNINDRVSEIGGEISFENMPDFGLQVTLVF